MTAKQLKLDDNDNGERHETKHVFVFEWHYLLLREIQGKFDWSYEQEDKVETSQEDCWWCRLLLLLLQEQRGVLFHIVIVIVCCSSCVLFKCLFRSQASL